VIGITLGDPGGIGPEISLKALAQPGPECRFIVFGSLAVLRGHAAHLGLPFDENAVEVVDIPLEGEPYFGPDPKRGGRASVAYLDAAFTHYHNGRIDGLVTGPIHKASWHECGFHYPGQTEFCAERTGSNEFFMLMAGAHFRIALLSTHRSLRDALDKVKKEEIIRMIRLVHREFRNLGWLHPRIGCAALNPHAGEAGAFGGEEAAEIEPALRQLRAEGLDVDGPLAPEVIFRVAAAELRWDVILAMYHDQAMIPFKLLDFEQSANVTLGLPLIRTSPDHGTAFDIAGQGKAHPGSMLYAVRLAVDWTLKRRQNAE
jgi:4-hydroxythreonine-4-phosphate dehydrogenase